jgi:predicted CXXCH cytochrome family protein
VTSTVIIAIVTLAAVQADPDSVCALARVDRARTLSSTCLSCHDGSAAPAVRADAPGGHGIHPVSVSYAHARAEVAIRVVGPLDARVVLPAGRVECVSCHADQGQGPHKTVVSIGELCTGCHLK